MEGRSRARVAGVRGWGVPVSSEATLAVLTGARESVAYGMTWVADAAVEDLASSEGVGVASALQGLAMALELDLAFVDAAATWADDTVMLLRDADVVSAWSIGGVLTRVADVRGWSEVMRASAGEPGALAVPVRKALDDVLVDMRRGKAAGAQVLVIADEVSSSAGWLVSPDFALEVLLPCYRVVVDEWGADGAVLFHSDGDVRALYRPLREAGFSAVHVAPARADDIGPSIAAALAAGLCPVGGVDIGVLRREGARRAAERAEAFLAPRIVFADDGGITALEEVTAFGVALDLLRTMRSR